MYVLTVTGVCLETNLTDLKLDQVESVTINGTRVAKTDVFRDRKNTPVGGSENLKIKFTVCV